MKITKLGHCCLLIEEKDVRILTDPGLWSGDLHIVKDIDIILITHEHSDHVHIDSLNVILKSNPKAKIYTNGSVAKKLDEMKLNYTIIEKSFKVNDVLIEPFGTKHAVIYKTLPRVENTCFLVNKRFFYPGDSLFIPKRSIEILALPVAGPWIKISEAIDYALKLKPKIVFPVHDGMINKEWITAYHKHPENILGQNKIRFIPASEGTVLEF